MDLRLHVYTVFMIHVSLLTVSGLAEGQRDCVCVFFFYLTILTNEINVYFYFFLTKIMHSLSMNTTSFV